MARIYHSASSVSLGERCPLAWLYCYVKDLRDPEIPWADFESGKFKPTDRRGWRMRATSLGKETHKRFEGWYAGEGMGHGLPAQIAACGAPFLPHPDACIYVATEPPIGGVAIDPGHDARPDAPRVAMPLFGINWAGFIDGLTQPTPAEWARLKLPAGHSWLVHDYKTTGSIRDWAKTAEQLADDLALSLYAAYGCALIEADAIPCRWLYLETKAVRRAYPVDLVQPLDRAMARINRGADVARVLDTISDEASAEAAARELDVKIGSACGDYGGCQYHESVGGPCRARRSVGALVSAQKVNKHMALSEEQKAKFAAMKPATTAPVAATTAPAPAQAETPVETPSTLAETPAPTAAPAAPTPAPAPAPAAAKRGPKPKVAAPAPGGVAAQLATLQGELAEIEGYLSQAQLAYAAKLAEIRALVAE